MSDYRYDVIVVGLGIMGAATLYQAAKRGAKVLGIDRYSPPHNFGSSHGDTRITRQAIGEGEMYMPFIQRSNEIWRELEEISGNRLYLDTGGLIISPATGGAQFHAREDFVTKTARIATAHNIEHEVLDSEQTIQRFPQFKVQPHEHVYYEPGAGVLRAEVCVKMQLEQAIQNGAQLNTNETVIKFEANDTFVRVETDNAIYEAEKLVLAAGAWLPGLLAPEYRQGLEIYRQVIYWFEADDIIAFTEHNFPFVIWIGDTLQDFFSAFPTLKNGIQGVKVLTEQYSKTTEAEALDRVVKPAEIAHLLQMTQARLHGVREKLVHADVCMYTVTSDEHFVLDFHPESDRIVIASPCSGHGFKHSAAVGETLAEMALNGQSTLDIRNFSLNRLKIQE